MQLQQVEPTELTERQRFGQRHVHQHTYAAIRASAGFGAQGGNDLRGHGRLDVARARPVKVEAQQVRSRLHGGAGVGQIRQTTDFDAHQPFGPMSSRICFAMSARTLRAQIVTLIKRPIR